MEALDGLAHHVAFGRPTYGTLVYWLHLRPNKLYERTRNEKKNASAHLVSNHNLLQTNYDYFRISQKIWLI